MTTKYTPAEWIEPSNVHEARQYQARLIEESLNIQGQLLASNAKDRSNDPEHLEWRRRAVSALNFRQQLVAKYNCWILDQPLSSADNARNTFLSDAVYFLDLYADRENVSDSDYNYAEQTVLQSLENYRTACETELLQQTNMVYVDSGGLAIR